MQANGEYCVFITENKFAAAVAGKGHTQKRDLQICASLGAGCLDMHFSEDVSKFRRVIYLIIGRNLKKL